MMKKFDVAGKGQVSEHNQKILDGLKSTLGFVPNTYAFMAHSRNALGEYLQYDRGKVSLSKKETEIISLVTSQVNNCRYCLSAHSQLAKAAGFTEEQVLDIRRGKVDSDPKLEVLARFCCEMVKNRGIVRQEMIDKFYKVGYTDENLVDTVMIISRTVFTNFINNVTQIPVDFKPEAPVIEGECCCGHQ